MTPQSNSHADAEPAALQNPAYLALREHYQKHPIILYTGAGVSKATDKRYGLVGWNDLVQQILEQTGAGTGTLEAYCAKTSEWADEPWRLAQWVAERVGQEVFQQQAAAIIQGRSNFQNRYKHLSGRFLSKAPTLNALTALCARFTHVVALEKGGYSYRVAPNPRVRAVITSNYDPFLEAGSSYRYYRPTLKPVAATTSSVGSLAEIPVFHVHGYVPFPGDKADEPGSVELRKPLVVTQDDYDDAWRDDDVYCQTMGVQVNWLRHHVALFVGFSFRDPWVTRMLSRLQMERSNQANRDGRVPLCHYALVGHRTLASKGEAFFDAIGVRPIPLDGYGEIPTLVRDLYIAGLGHDNGPNLCELAVIDEATEQRMETRLVLTSDEYWHELQSCSNRRTPRGRRVRLA